jgi:hypothetical protein
VTKAPKFPAVSSSVTAPPISNECTTAQELELNTTTPPYPLPKKQKLPVQGKSKLKPTPA